MPSLRQYISHLEKVCDVYLQSCQQRGWLNCAPMIKAENHRKGFNFSGNLVLTSHWNRRTLKNRWDTVNGILFVKVFHSWKTSQMKNIKSNTHFIIDFIFLCTLPLKHAAFRQSIRKVQSACPHNCWRCLISGWSRQHWSLHIEPRWADLGSVVWWWFDLRCPQNAMKTRI